MSVRTVLLGMLLVCLGCDVLLADRERARDLFWLEGFQSALQDGPGRVVHLLLFGVLPPLLGALALYDGLGLDFYFRSEPEVERAAPVQRDPEEQARFDLNMAIGRLIVSGFHIRHGDDDSIRVHDGQFTAVIAPADSAWLIACPDRKPVTAETPDTAVSEVLKCHQPKALGAP